MPGVLVYCLWQFHLAENLPSAINLQVANFVIIHQIHLHHGFPWVPTHSQLSPNNSPGPRVVQGFPKIAIFQPTHASPKRAKSSRVGPYRGANLGNFEIAPGPRHWLEGPYRRKMWNKLRF